MTYLWGLDLLNGQKNTYKEVTLVSEKNFKF